MSARSETLLEAAKSSAHAADRIGSARRGLDAGGERRATLNVALGLAHELHALTLTVEAALLPPEPRADAPPEVQEGWFSPIELMGHRRRDGYIRAVTLAGRPLIEIRVPQYERPHRLWSDTPRTGPVVIAESVEYYSPAAVFSLTPASEETVMAALGHVTATENTDRIPF